MNRAVKTVAMVAAALLVVGVLLASFAFAVGAPTSYYWDRGLRAWSHSDRNHAFADEVTVQTDSFSAMDLETSAYHVVFERTSGEYSVSYRKLEQDSVPRFHVENGVLKLEADLSDSHSRAFPLFRNFNAHNDFNERLLTIRFPENVKLTELKLESDMNDLLISDLTADKINLDLSLGAIELSGVSTQKLEIDAALGDVKLRDCKADYADISLQMGSMSGDNLEMNGLNLDVQMGSVELDGVFLGKTKVDAQMGSVNVSNRIPSESCFVNTTSSLGNTSVHGGASGGTDSPNRLDIEVGMGSVDVRFED